MQAPMRLPTRSCQATQVPPSCTYATVPAWRTDPHTRHSLALTRDDEHADRVQQREQERRHPAGQEARREDGVGHQQPRHEDQRRCEHHDRDEVARDGVCGRLDGCLVALCLLDSSRTGGEGAQRPRSDATLAIKGEGSCCHPGAVAVCTPVVDVDPEGGDGLARWSGPAC